MTFPHSYQVNVRWSQGRTGLLSSPEVKPSFDVAPPPPFPGGEENVWSPEHLFTASVNSCFMTTFLAIAENSKLSFQEFSCGATGVLDVVEGQYRMTHVSLQPRLVIANAEDGAKALRVLEKAEKACLITNSINATVSLQPTVLVAKPV
jgi:organic hydroperoxide reductase OsmC/OhrA